MQFVFKSLMDAYCLVKHLENEGKLCRISNTNTKCLYMYRNMPVAESTQLCLGLFMERGERSIDSWLFSDSFRCWNGENFSDTLERLQLVYTSGPYIHEIHINYCSRSYMLAYACGQHDVHNDTCTWLGQPRERKPITTVWEREAQLRAGFIDLSFSFYFVFAISLAEKVFMRPFN